MIKFIKAPEPVKQQTFTIDDLHRGHVYKCVDCNESTYIGQHLIACNDSRVYGLWLCNSLIGTYVGTATTDRKTMRFVEVDVEIRVI